MYRVLFGGRVAYLASNSWESIMNKMTEPEYLGMAAAVGGDTRVDRSLVKSTVGDCEVRVVSTLDERQMAIAIRAAVFLGEEAGEYGQHFEDGNDCLSTFLIVFVDGNPVGTVRIRFFGSFARLDKLAILKHHRRLAVLNHLIRGAFRFCRAKGFSHIEGSARPEVVRFWERQGCRPSGPAIETKYGPLIPIFGDIPEIDDVQTARAANCGEAAFELSLFGPESRLMAKTA